MHADRRDGLGVFETHMTPRPAAVGGFINPVALQNVGAQLALAHADIDDVRIRRGDRHRADGRTLDLAVRHRPPRHTAVGRFPQAAAGRAEIEFRRAFRAAGRGDRPPAA